jgi:hypothetical protein
MSQVCIKLNNFISTTAWRLSEPAHLYKQCSTTSSIPSIKISSTWAAYKMSPSAKINILITGATGALHLFSINYTSMPNILTTGYIGGTVLLRFLAHPQASSFAITALVRSPEKVAKLKDFGITSVLGSTSDSQLLEKLASKADVVISIVCANNLCLSRRLKLCCV